MAQVSPLQIRTAGLNGSPCNQAVSQGLDAAGTALSRTYDELAHNEELHKGVEFGLKAAEEVSKDVGSSVAKDLGWNLWDTGGEKAAAKWGLESTARTLNNPAVTIPLNKAINAGRIVQDVWGGDQERSAKDLGSRIDEIYTGVYGRGR